jgi:hypothetical protein
MLARVQGKDRRVRQPWRNRLGWIVDSLRSIDAVAGDVVVDVPLCLGGGLITEALLAAC